MCLSIPSSDRSLCSTSSPIPKPSVPPIFKSCIQGGINVRDFSSFGMFVYTIHYISSNRETEPEKVPPALSLLPIFLYSCGVTGETWIGTKSASCLRPWRPRDDWEAKESPRTQDQLTRDQRETPPSPPPPFPRALSAIPKFDTRKTFAPLFMFKTPEWRS